MLNQQSYKIEYTGLPVGEGRGWWEHVKLGLEVSRGGPAAEEDPIGDALHGLPSVVVGVVDTNTEIGELCATRGCRVSQARAVQGRRPAVPQLSLQWSNGECADGGWEGEPNYVKFQLNFSSYYFEALAPISNTELHKLSLTPYILHSICCSISHLNPWIMVNKLLIIV
jgi:hypothetical protein